MSLAHLFSSTTNLEREVARLAAELAARTAECELLRKSLAASEAERRALLDRLLAKNQIRPVHTAPAPPNPDDLPAPRKTWRDRAYDEMEREQAAGSDTRSATQRGVDIDLDLETREALASAIPR